MISQIKSNLGLRVSPRIIGAVAQIATVIFLTLSVFDVPKTDFIQGVLAGFSIVGNLFFLYHTRKPRQEDQ
jgi:hypothetical protein